MVRMTSLWHHLLVGACPVLLNHVKLTSYVQRLLSMLVSPKVPSETSDPPLPNIHYEMKRNLLALRISYGILRIGISQRYIFLMIGPPPPPPPAEDQFLHYIVDQSHGTSTDFTQNANLSYCSLCISLQVNALCLTKLNVQHARNLCACVLGWSCVHIFNIIGCCHNQQRPIKFLICIN